MQVSRQAWHFRFLSAMECKPPRNLCSYFWMVVLHLVMVAFFVTLGGGMVLLTLAPILAIWFPSFEGVVIVGYIIWIGILTTVWLCYRHWRRDQRGYIEQPDGLAVAWVKAKKRKVCPLIEYTS